MKNILITGAAGQIGSELTMALRKIYGNKHVVATGHKTRPGETFLNSGPFYFIDCTRIETIVKVVKKYKIDTIYHLASILSAVAEKNPQLAWNININGLYNVLEVAREFNCAVFIPSSIGAFGPSTPLDNTPQETIQRPNTIYGVTKVSGELLSDYYFHRFAVDTRGVRYPGIISSETPPGGGTTDYAVDIYGKAVQHGKYTCYLKAGTFLDMIYMPDALKAAISIMEAEPEKLKHRNAYNLAAMSFDPEMIAGAIKKQRPEFTIDYDIDPVRQAIAESWPNKMDDSAARAEWGWNPDFDLESMTRDMLMILLEKNRVQGE